jgi:hypothetical protein
MLEIRKNVKTVKVLFVCLLVLSRTSNFSAIWRLSPLPVTGLQRWANKARQMPIHKQLIEYPGI